MNATRVIALSSAVGAVIAATLFLTGCSPAATPTAGPSEAPTSDFQHIHELVPDASDGTLLIATHEGLYRLTIGSGGATAAAGPIGGLDFDPMGFTLANGIAARCGPWRPSVAIQADHQHDVRDLEQCRSQAVDMANCDHLGRR
jgi:hypothetical protein